MVNVVACSIRNCKRDTQELQPVLAPLFNLDMSTSRDQVNESHVVYPKYLPFTVSAALVFRPKNTRELVDSNPQNNLITVFHSEL